jgi:NADPH2:quinone reductase
LADAEVEVRLLADAALAHERLENHSANGRVVLSW